MMFKTLLWNHAKPADRIMRIPIIIILCLSPILIAPAYAAPGGADQPSTQTSDLDSYATETKPFGTSVYWENDGPSLSATTLMTVITATASLRLLRTAPDGWRVLPIPFQ